MAIPWLPPARAERSRMTVRVSAQRAPNFARAPASPCVRQVRSGRPAPAPAWAGSALLAPVILLSRVVPPPLASSVSASRPPRVGASVRRSLRAGRWWSARTASRSVRRIRSALWKPAAEPSASLSRPSAGSAAVVPSVVLPLDAGDKADDVLPGVRRAVGAKRLRGQAA